MNPAIVAMRSICRLLMLMISFASALSAYAQYANTPHDLNEAAFWLEGKTQQLVRGSRATMPDGTSGFEPAASGFYPCFWTRDYAYMVEGCPEAFTPAELKNACYTLVNAIRSDGYAVECINVKNGHKYYRPGYDAANAYGVNPTADNSQFTVDIAWRTYQITKDAAVLNKVCRSNGRTIIDNLVTEMKMVPRRQGMVYIDPKLPWDRSPYGFTDSVKKTGNELYCSLLDVRAGNELADLLTVVGRTGEAATWRAAAAAETAAIQTTFWNSSYTASNPGLFNAATVKCNQFDVWGSAFAVQLGVATPAQAASIANYFNKNYSTLVLLGQIREIPAPNYWQDTICARGTDVNGGYWGVAAGHFADALMSVNPTLARQTLLDMVNFYRAQNDVPEYTKPGGVAGGAGSDCAGATLPLVQLKRYMLNAQPALRSMKGTLAAATDVALASNGGTAFAKDARDPAHVAARLNDGAYGDGNGWIANSQSSFAGVAFKRAHTISSLAFGRDNMGASKPLHGHLHLPIHDYAEPKRRHAGCQLDVLWGLLPR